MNNPVFKQASTQLGRSVGGGSLTLNNTGLTAVLNKAALQFAVVLVAAIVTAAAMPDRFLSPAVLATGLMAMVLAFAVSFMRRVWVPLLFMYALIEGVFVGGVSRAYSDMYTGVVPTAVVATTVTAGVIILGVRANLIRTTSRVRRIFGYALAGYLVFSLVALVAAVLGHPLLSFGSPLLLVVSVFGVFMASFSLVTDVENARDMSVNADENMQWRLGFGFIVSLIWLYVEMLRLVTNITAMSRN